MVLKDLTEVTNDAADALFVAGCEDAPPASFDITTWVRFDRRASSLEEEAIRSGTALRLTGAEATARQNPMR